jgi:hypothetical protein
MNLNKISLPIDIIYYIVNFSDDYLYIIKKNNLLILTKSENYILDKLNKLCEKTNNINLKSWGNYYKICMYDLYKKCSYYTLHTILKSHYTYTDEFINSLMDEDTIHYISLTYYNLSKKIYNNDKLNVNDKKNYFILFWNFCSFYYMKHNKFNKMTK